MVNPSTPTFVTRADLARWLGVTSAGLQKHIDSGVLTKTPDGYDLHESIIAYCAHLREGASGRPGSEAAAKNADAKERLTVAQAEAQEMKNKIAKGALINAEAAERAWADALRNLRAQLLGIPSRLRMRLGHLQPSDITTIDREIRDTLTDIGNARAREAADDDEDEDDGDGER